MKKKHSYKVGQKVVEKEINYIPVRYIIAILMTVVEVLAIVGTVIALCIIVPYFYIAAWLTEIACVIKIISSNDNPEYKIPWLLFVLILPIFGFMLYFIFYSRKLNKKLARRIDKVQKDFALTQDQKIFDTLGEQSLVAHNQAKLICNLSGSTLFANTKQKYYALGEDMHKDMLIDLSKAQKFIFVDYFIIEEGLFWNSILDILRQKAKEGVEVKVVYDDIGCMSTLPGDYAKVLKSFGIDATPFARLKGNADGEFNNRSHRKILIVDGIVGYTGGVNIADEYINEAERFGHWKDVGVRLQGSAVHGFTQLFLFDWGINVKDMALAGHDYFPQCDEVANGYVLPFGDGPNPVYQHRVGKHVIQSMVASATKKVCITTPYLILDNDLCQSLENASLRGVEVKIVIPHIPDKKLVFGMSKSFASRLMQSGVQIYEYTPGFVHAKTYLVDDKIAMVGTINLDYRSLVHHFENAVWMYDCECIADIKADLEDTLTKSVEVSEADYKPTVIQRIIRSIVKIFAPLL